MPESDWLAFLDRLRPSLGLIALNIPLFGDRFSFFDESTGHSAVITLDYAKARGIGRAVSEALCALLSVRGK